MRKKDSDDLKLNFNVINHSTNSQHQEENRLYLRRQNRRGEGHVNAENSDCDVSA